MILRNLENILQKHFFKNKIIVLTGPRQVGKTTLLKKIRATQKEKVLWLNADTFEVQTLFENNSLVQLKSIFKNKKIIFIDEAQNIKDIGLKLKIIIDEIEDVQLVVTGSSAFELANELNEPLTGRKFEYTMYPISFQEMVEHHGLLEELHQLKNRMVFGYYPDVVVQIGSQKEVLNLLANSYLFKDILIWNRIKKSDKLVKLLQALAFQIGHQVSYNELSKTIGIDSETVEKYIQLLEQSFVVFRLHSFSRNLRSELKKSKKIYFFDVGIRNAVIANYNVLELRNNEGALWENFAISERKKYLMYNQMYANTFFWRTKAQQEIDYLEEREGKLYAYEFKWNANSKNKISKTFLNSYPNAIVKTITPQNIESFIN
jgi:predicted AAA+ superfamily ATPase